jgi:hypothetical protein
MCCFLQRFTGRFEFLCMSANLLSRKIKQFNMHLFRKVTQFFALGLLDGKKYKYVTTTTQINEMINIPEFWKWLTRRY